MFDESTYTTELKLQEEDGPVNMFCETEKNCRKGGRTLNDSWSKLERRSISSTFSHGSYSMMHVRKLLERIKPKKVSFPMSHIQLGILPWILLWERSRISNSFAIVKMSGNSLTLQADIPNLRRLGKEELTLILVLNMLKVQHQFYDLIQLNLFKLKLKAQYMKIQELCREWKVYLI